MTGSRLIPLLALVIACAGAGPAAAQSGTYGGTVVSADMPVGGVTVWLLYREDEAARLIETRSDAQGKFHLRGPEAANDKVVGLIARAADGRLGWHMLGRYARWDDSASDTERRIQLLPVGAARGRLTDSAGKPVAGGTIRASLLQLRERDSPPPLDVGDVPAELAQYFKAVSTDDGTFALSGIPLDASVYAALAAPAAPTVRTPERIAAECKAANYVIDKVLAMPEPATGGYQMYVFRYLVRIDPERARKWLAAHKPKAGLDSAYARALRRADIERVAGDDVDEALTLAAPVPPRFAIPLLLELAARFTASDPPRALRFAEEAVVRARTLDPAARAEYLAHAGDLVIGLGRAAAGKKLLDEAVAIAAKLGTEDRAGYDRARIAQFLAVHDLPRARTVVNGAAAAEANRYLSMLAMRMARTDAKTALALVDEMKADRSSSRALAQMAIARRVAERDPAQAVRILDAIDDASYKVRYQAEGLAHVAVIVAPRDKKLAWSLIDRSLALYLDEAQALRSWSNFGGRSVFAAWTAGQAQAAGYPDLPSVVARVLACRPTDEESHSPAHKLETLVRMAKVLALVDPASARQMLEVVNPRRHLLGTGYSGFEHQDWLVARCLAEPERTPVLVDEAIAALALPKAKGDFYHSGLMQLANVLTAPPEQRVAIVMGLNSSLALRAEDW